MSRPAWWTDADSAELSVLVAELLRGLAAHEASCPTCQALAEPCPLREKIRREDLYDRAPLSAPRGFYADLRERLDEHEASCPTCRLAKRGRCRAVGEAIELVLEWRFRRGLLSRAEWHRRRHVFELLTELRKAAA